MRPSLAAPTVYLNKSVSISLSSEILSEIIKSCFSWDLYGKVDLMQNNPCKVLTSHTGYTAAVNYAKF